MQIPDLTEVEAWKGGTLTTGSHDCVIERVEEGTSAGGHPELKVLFRAIESDPEPGAIITDWLTVTPNTLGRLKSFLQAAQIYENGPAADLNPEILVGQSIRVTVGPHRTPEGTEVMRVKGFHRD